MLNPATNQRQRPFGHVADVLFQIIIQGDLSMALTLSCLNKATRDAIEMLEPHICGWFIRSNGIPEFDPVLTLNPFTGRQMPLTMHTLQRFSQRQDTAQKLARRIVPSVWGQFSNDGDAEMNMDAELQLAQRLERGLYVLFHFSDIGCEMSGSKQRGKKNPSPVVTGRLLAFTQLLDDYDKFPEHKRQSISHEEHRNHIYTVLKWGAGEADIGQRRLEFRGSLDEQTEIDFHAALRMLRELTERMLLRHGPRDWHRDAKNEYSVISWFLLQQSPRSLAKLFLSPEKTCCDIGEKQKVMENGVRVCYYSDPLDDYWQAWKNEPNLGCQDCDCKRRARSWSVKPVLIDARGREYNRAAERYLREMWSQRHVGLHRAFMTGQFSTIL
ncbi:hypothetical protein AWENTII_002747 [Aspergillus wentii]